jgi:hypothetical protein
MYTFRENFPVINWICRHGNRGQIFLGSESARLGLRGGDSHFWVIQFHECSGDVCFLI